MIDLGKKSVLGIEVNAIDYEAAVARVIDSAKRQQPMSVTALAVHGVMTGVQDKTHRYRLNRFDLVCPDGQPVRWALNSLHGLSLPDRVYGPELTLRLCAAASKEDVSIFLFGATEEMLKQFADNLTEKFDGLRIAGIRASRFRQISPEERDDLVDEIRSSGAQMCFVGLGCPRQEIFAYEMRDRLGMPLIAVGAAFAFHAGMLDQAPRWMQDRGLEWFYRLTKEPGRLWRRYVLLNPAYLSLLAMQKLGLRRESGLEESKPTDDLLFG
ncbi:WecB/TagA/CpsF family glycosyltransferase [Crateriforma conspicua]|uniref:WecB/TagA/CpsF family glycosyltransferase n=1 Tax=Crateriforma conspicua TaxID=2527996 RepID=UPI001189C88E|nr:WecB/TagA/CpsF family glycosyltransferase [Crateriforma conspicua]QDV64916.1 Putative N-acetylmannosaminyltransferase [Crateriforma conspicua]